LCVFLPDDHAVVRDGLKALITAQSDRAVPAPAARKHPTRITFEPRIGLLPFGPPALCRIDPLCRNPASCAGINGAGRGPRPP
jgi:hypothetical protein